MNPPERQDAGVVFIGRIRTPFVRREDCPKNPRDARALGGTAVLEVDAAYRPGLLGLEAHSHLVLLYWMDEAARNVLIQTPRGRTTPRGVFSIRSPARPNPIALSVAGLLRLDADAGLVEVEQLDCRDGTPLIDIKPYRPGIDSVPGATVDDQP